MLDLTNVSENKSNVQIKNQNNLIPVKPRRQFVRPKNVKPRRLIF
jgi:hypothetical protein